MYDEAKVMRLYYFTGSLGSVLIVIMFIGFISKQWWDAVIVMLVFIFCSSLFLICIRSRQIAEEDLIKSKQQAGDVPEED